ncbi:MAG: hypothetical protein HOV78_02020 [Hamadaea sp.]|nr:hypothetical protein [Hamadaea sp.]
MSMRTRGEPLRWWGWLVVVAVALVTVGSVALVWWLPVLGLPLFVVAGVVAGVASVGGRPGRRVGFLVGPSGFGVPLGWRAIVPALAGLVLVAAFLLGQAGVVVRHGDDVVLRATFVVWLLMGGALAAVCVRQIVVAVRRSGAVTVTAAGLMLRQPLGTVLISWSGVLPGAYRAEGWCLVFGLSEQPRLWGAPTHNSAVPVRRVAVDPRFLAEVVDFYVRHPERRAAIGSAEEHRRLCADLAAVQGSGGVV